MTLKFFLTWNKWHCYFISLLGSESKKEMIVLISCFIVFLTHICFQLCSNSQTLQKGALNFKRAFFFLIYIFRKCLCCRKRNSYYLHWVISPARTFKGRNADNVKKTSEVWVNNAKQLSIVMLSWLCFPIYQKIDSFWNDYYSCSSSFNLYLSLSVVRQRREADAALFSELYRKLGSQVV